MSLSLVMSLDLAVAGDVLDDVLFCAVLFSHDMSCMRSGTELSQLLRICLPTHALTSIRLLHGGR